MTASPLRVLIVDDSPDDAALLERSLRKAGLDVEALRVDRAETMAEALTGSDWDIVLSDHSMPEFSSSGALSVLAELAPEVPAVVVSGAIGEEAAVRTLREGAADYVLKDKLARLAPTVERTLAETERKKDLARAEAAQQRLAAVVATTTDLVAIADLDADGETERVVLNDAGRRVLGIEPAGGLSPAPPDTWGRIVPAEGLQAALSGGIWSGETEVWGPDGPTPLSEVVIAGLAGADSGYAAVIARDISDRKRFESELAYLADHDPLTGLYNRRRFQSELERQLDYCARYGAHGAVLFCDLDNFKYVNDTFGHDAGNSLLQSVAEVLRQRLRASDVLSRLGGDEFAVMLVNAGAEEARSVAFDIVRVIRERATITGRGPVRVSASIGVALFGDRRVTADEVLIHADRAMYAAKDAGRDTACVFTPEQGRRAREGTRLTWEQRIRDALEQDRLVLHLQPVVSLADRSTTGYEALVRMVDPTGELIRPGAFLGAAERFGLIHPIDRWVIRNAIGILADHPGLDFPIGINLSGTSVGNPEVLPLIEEEVARAGIDPHRLVFEVTETSAIANMAEATSFARTLSELGCRFALDDFGVGFGSFYYLKHLPLDFLKIDGEFIRNIVRRPADQVMVRAMVELARGLGKQTIAEFVSDDETAALLHSFGVDYGQGFHLGPPAPVEETLDPAGVSAGQ